MRAMFPAGTVSGAPKPRAMEIIEELEPVRRGPYAGALGYFSFNGNADFAITIRTLVANGTRCSIQAGAGIVADSDPEKEWHETESKAAGLMKAVERATGRRLDRGGEKMKVLVIDNYDSFVYNLAQYVGELGGEPEVFRNDAITLRQVRDMAPDRIIISPGPGHPGRQAVLRRLRKDPPGGEP